MPKQVCELQGQVAWEYITVHFVYLNISGTNIKNYKHVRVVVTGPGLGEQLRVANNLFAKRLTFKQIMVTGFSFIDLIVLKILIDGGQYKILELHRIIRFIKKQEFVSLEYISFKFLYIEQYRCPTCYRCGHEDLKVDFRFLI